MSVHQTAPLQADWIRNHLYKYDDVATNLSVLTSDAIAGATLMNTRFHAQWSSETGDSGDCITTAPFLLIPTETHGAETVGLVVLRERIESSTASPDDSSFWESFSTSSIGRYYFSSATGALLVFSSPLPLERDTTEHYLAVVQMVTGRQAGYAGSSSVVPQTAKRRKMQVLWWPSIRGRMGSTVPLGCAMGEKLFCVVDSELFEQCRFQASILVATYSENSARPLCTDCDARVLPFGSMSHHGEISTIAFNGGPITCQCQEHLHTIMRPTDAAQVLMRNMRLAFTGTWLSDADALTRVPGGSGQVCAVKQALRFTLDFRPDFDITERLKSLAITRSMTSISLPKQIMPTTYPAECETILLEDVGTVIDNVLRDTSAEAVAESDDLDCIVQSLEESWMPVEVCPSPEPFLDIDNSDTLLKANCVAVAPTEHPIVTRPKKREFIATDLERTMERKQRNREAAARSNALRKHRNEQLTSNLRSARKRAVELRTIEMELRAENINLRTRWEGTRAVTRKPGSLTGP